MGGGVLLVGRTKEDHFSSLLVDLINSHIFPNTTLVITLLVYLDIERRDVFNKCDKLMVHLSRMHENVR